MNDDARRQPSAVVNARGHWRIQIAILESAATRKRATRPLSDLRDVLDDSQVRLRGWYFPHLEREHIRNVGAYIEGGGDADRYRERWRLYRDAVFLAQVALRDDWAGDDTFEKGVNRKDRLNVIDAVFTLTEIFHFAARLAVRWRDSRAVHISTTLNNASGRHLWISDERRAGFDESYRNDSPVLTVVDSTFDVLELQSDPNLPARAAAMELFQAFGWSATDAIVQSMQDELRRR